MIALAVAPAAAQDGGDESRAPFTEAERRLLLAGRLVRRDFTRVEGDSVLYGGASWQRVRAPVERVWATASDPSALPRLIPSLDESRVVRPGQRSRTLYMHHSYGPAQASYHVRVELDEGARMMRFELDRSRPRDIRAGRGFLSLSSYQGDTIVEWGMLVDPGGGMVTQLFGSMLGEWLLLPPRCVRDELESRRERTCR